MRGHGDGFTIIELMLFLGISALLLSVMFIGTGSLASRQRFSESTDSLQAYIQAQYDQVVNGVNVRGANDECVSGDTSQIGGQSKECLLLGKALTFKGTSIDSRYIISTSSLVGDENNDRQRFIKVGLKAADSDVSTYEIKWGATVFNVTRAVGASRSQVDSIAFLRVPDTGRIVSFYYFAGLKTPTDGLKDAISIDYTNSYNPAGSMPANPSLSICIQNNKDYIVNSPKSAVIIDQGNGASSILTNYSPGAVLCP